MMSEKFAVMFADIAESTRLYDTFGDETAERCISGHLSSFATIVHRHGGIVIKTIGDEIMCRFSSSDAAITAACAMQEETRSNRTTPNKIRLALRVGIHVGPAILKEDDLFGDAVNVAARVTHQVAKPGQIIISHDTFHTLSPPAAAMARRFDRTWIRGRAAEIDVYEVVWDDRDVTTIMTSPVIGRDRSVGTELVLTCNGIETTVKTGSHAIQLGRDSMCDLIINSSLVSRLHSLIECRQGKFVLIDKSTNGTYVHTKDNKEIFLRREEFFLNGSGMISLGEPVLESEASETIYFRLKRGPQ